MPSIIVLGTGTGIGKTYAACQIAKLLTGQRASSRVLALKPIETGLQDLQESDAALLARTSSPNIPVEHAYAFECPVSPHLAARRRGIEIEIPTIIHWITKLCQRHNACAHDPTIDDHATSDWLLIESAGGAFSPISDVHTNVDLAIALEPAIWVLVGADRLGVLHDMRATLSAMVTSARMPDIILLNAPPIPDSSTGTNRGELERLGWANVTAQLAWNGDFEQEDRGKLLEILNF
jgi:dethiobiotin synthetase